MNDYTKSPTLRLGDKDLERLDRVYRDYRMLYENPEQSYPMVIVNIPVANSPSWQQQLANPMVMLNTQLEQLRTHLEIGDDCAPAVRINFGTGQVAAAFGCPLKDVENSLPAVKTPILKEAKDSYRLSMPALNAGWYDKLSQWNEIWLEHLPEGIAIQHPDIQGPFNTAHLIRGNDILTDFYDDPESVEHLLDLVTDYMIKLVPHLKSMIGEDEGWFLDWLAMWKGAGRISNCSTTMIDPEFYKRFIFPRDQRLIDSIGGGRIHYCGGSREIIHTFFTIAGLGGLDCDCQYHDLWELSLRAPAHVPLIFQQYGQPFPFMNRLLKGDWPKKRNVIIITQASTIEEGKKLYQDIRNSFAG